MAGMSDDDARWPTFTTPGIAGKTDGLGPHHCRCKTWQVACKTRITQEDLLCDNCRAGCSLLTFRPAGATPDLERAEHVQVSDFEFSLDAAVPGTIYGP